MPTAAGTVAALIKGHWPRVFQARGWMLAGLTLMPLALGIMGYYFDDAPNPARVSLELFHQGYVQIVLPILALIAAPACIREDLEQRTLPLMLARPSPVWALPMGKGMLWFAWCSIWLIISVSSMLAMWMHDALATMGNVAALLLTFWAQLGFAVMMLWFFKRGTLWAALAFFVWEPGVVVFPAAIQRLTFRHYLESLVGSRYSEVNTVDFLAQQQVATDFWLAAIILISFGCLAWGLTGYRLMRMPIGLAGREAEG
jgi:ABC-type transport system involved in multi-copper enzyme maturation permease subunit